ncbi:MAG: hypothetical protein A3B96_03325 [Candidatus Spechtbacteria bacterium RIFCSPHIGHO2_02_FULL_43_15b]|uniref:Nudix hydrolase domain-containing protein n=1 Tax=Candidatus Spechtbacteria bacterium RIFCSPHIGHO2_01_FULL_43_30 TaxID=1802158 RepID=A0A1G2H4J3_9BACT|nr:MAG: hypothetical protein A2827_00910 [Candidatus Spechtbacteria bacterium RIFCSPHIGHO2_01_FULL_43_30]OGZ58872.1 MAG: hypothetical protein A3B96_03325 [Candidatus Spechtbacteria bacterium RIFCSPHIGHO2_02_FULL_43_15b]
MARYASVVIVFTPRGIPLVREWGEKNFWKIPGGKSENYETAEECAVREVMEEVGVDLSLEDLAEIFRESNGEHTFVAFVARKRNVLEFKKFGDEGEEVRIFSPQDILSLKDLLPRHRLVLLKNLQLFRKSS